MKLRLELKAMSIRNILKRVDQRRLLAKFDRQMGQINKLGEAGARVCFLDAFPSHYQFSKETIRKLAQTNSVVLLVLDESHPAYRDKDTPNNVHVFLLDRRWMPFALDWLRIPYLVTPASHLHPSAVRPDLNVVHSYHSLVSMHAVYGDDAFDTYTHFLACGPHHVREAVAIKAARGLPAATIFEVGYPKLDDLSAMYAAQPKTKGDKKTILLAPSWHPENLLTSHGEALCRSILELGHDLIVRPHPHLYERDTATMDALRFIVSASNGCITIENPNEAFDSFWRADLMISDWSGVALEYAFATERPVVFIDAPRKVNSVELLKIDIPTVEDTLRSKVGVVVESVARLSEGIISVFSTPSEDWAYRIRTIRDDHIYNYMNSAEAGAGILAKLSEDAKMLPPTSTSRDRLVELINYYSG